MKLSTLANFTLSVCNGSHRLSEPKGKTKKTQHRSTVQAGIANTSDPRLQAAVTRLCAVRQVNAGAITTLLKNANKRETQLANGLRIANEEQEKAKMAKKHTNKVWPLPSNPSPNTTRTRYGFPNPFPLDFFRPLSSTTLLKNRWQRQPFNFSMNLKQWITKKVFAWPTSKGNLMPV